MYSFEEHILLVLTAHEECDREGGLEMKYDYFLYPMQCPVVWSMKKRNIYRGIPTKYTKVTGHVQ